LIRTVCPFQRPTAYFRAIPLESVRLKFDEDRQ
jgi:hypothetical protein